jgi:hypothetical protein
MVVAPVLQTTLEAHAGVVTAVEYINDDDVFITSSMDCSFAVWQRRGSGMSKGQLYILAISLYDTAIILRQGTTSRRLFKRSMRRLSPTLMIGQLGTSSLA